MITEECSLSVASRSRNHLPVLGISIAALFGLLPLLVSCSTDLSQRDRVLGNVFEFPGSPRFWVSEWRGANGYSTEVTIHTEARDGIIRPCWSGNLYGYMESTNICDLDTDSMPEIVLLSRWPGSGAYKTVTVLEWDGARLLHLPLPKWYDDESGYMGHEGMILTATQLIVTHPVYLEGDGNCCPCGGTAGRVFELNGNRFVLTDRLHWNTN